MITLATLKDATEQDVFDQVKDHLLKQNERSKEIDGGLCKYRGENGLKCAAGCLISDKEYRKSFEGWSWGLLISRHPKKFNSPHNYLIEKLQYIHDQHEPKEWPYHLKELAKELNLKY